MSRALFFGCESLKYPKILVTFAPGINPEVPMVKLTVTAEGAMTRLLSLNTPIRG